MLSLPNLIVKYYSSFPLRQFDKRMDVCVLVGMVTCLLSVLKNNLEFSVQFNKHCNCTIVTRKFACPFCVFLLF